MKENMDKNFLYDKIRKILISSRKEAYRAVNTGIIKCYHEIGRVIVEKEQAGNMYAKYGKELLKDLALKLTKEFGAGFDKSNLNNMRKFYLLYPNFDAVRQNLTWTHYRTVLKIEDKTERDWYLAEAAKEQWSSRQLSRQISTMYYRRLLASRDKAPVVAEARQLLQKETPKNFIKEPYIL